MALGSLAPCQDASENRTISLICLLVGFDPMLCWRPTHFFVIHLQLYARRAFVTHSPKRQFGLGCNPREPVYQGLRVPREDPRVRGMRSSIHAVKVLNYQGVTREQLTTKVEEYLDLPTPGVVLKPPFSPPQNICKIGI